MTYVLKWTNPSSPNPIITIADGTANTSATPLTLTGKGYLNWGLPVQQSLLYLLENFANPTQPGTFTLGQAWFNSGNTPPSVSISTTTGRLAVNVGPTGSNWLELAYRRLDLPPTSPQISDLYYTNHTLKVYDGGWQSLAFTAQYDAVATMPTLNHYDMVLSPAISTYSNNFICSFVVPVTNTGLSYINAGGGNVELFTTSGSSLVAGDLQAGDLATYLYSNGNAYLMAPTASQLGSDYLVLSTGPTGPSPVPPGKYVKVPTTVGPGSQEAISRAEADIAYTAAGTIPPGTIITFAGITVPTGYLQCLSVPTPVVIASYPALYAAVGNTWGGQGSIQLSGGLNTLVPGSNYLSGYYYNVPLTSGSGSGATATIYVNVTASSGSGTIYTGVVTSCTIVNPGVGYVVNDTLYASIGTQGAGFSIKVAAVLTLAPGTFISPWFPDGFTAVNATTGIGSLTSGSPIVHDHRSQYDSRTPSGIDYLSAYSEIAGVGSLWGYPTTGGTGSGPTNIPAGVKVMHIVKT